MALQTPTVVSSGSMQGRDGGTIFESDSIETSSGNLVVLALITGGRNPLTGLLPESVIGCVENWTFIGSNNSSNERVRLSVYSGVSKGVSESIILEFTSESEKVGYKLIEFNGASSAPKQYSVGTSEPEVELPDVVDTSGTLGLIAQNTSSSEPEPIEGYSKLGEDVIISAPSGTLSSIWSLPGRSTVGFNLTHGAGQATIGLEIAEYKPEETLKLYLVVDGQEVEVESFLVSEGVETPANLSI